MDFASFAKDFVDFDFSADPGNSTNRCNYESIDELPADAFPYNTVAKIR